MSDLEQRAERLTPREWRVVALVLEGVPVSQACDSLGIAAGTFESHKQAIRRKLGVPRGERLEGHLQAFAGRIPDPETFQRSTPTPPEEEANAERRVRLLFRMTMDELFEVAGSAELRASLLEQTVKRMSSDDVSGAQEEVEDLRTSAAQVRELAKSLIERVRSRNTAP